MTGFARMVGYDAENNERYVRLGKIMLAAVGEEACREGYGTTDPEWVGRYALDFGDIRPDGELT